MFSNIGGKIKMVAKILCWVGIIVSILCGGGLIATGVLGALGEELPAAAAIAAGIAWAAVGSLLSWVGSFFIYGFGELIDKTAEIAENTRLKY